MPPLKENQIVLKITGIKEQQVLETAKKIESIYSLYLESKVKPNDKNDGCHIYITIVVAAEGPI
jgi:hypothetical protein